MREERGRTVETGVEARAGFLDRPVLIVLARCGSAFSAPALDAASHASQWPGSTITLGAAGRLVFATTSDGTSLVSTVQFWRARSRKRLSVYVLK